MVTLIKDYEVCKKEQVLTPEQAKILELFEHKLATFRFNLVAHWNVKSNFEQLADEKEESDDEKEAECEDAEMSE